MKRKWELIEDDVYKENKENNDWKNKYMNQKKYIILVLNELFVNMGGNNITNIIASYGIILHPLTWCLGIKELAVRVNKMIDRFFIIQICGETYSFYRTKNPSEMQTVMEMDAPCGIDFRFIEMEESWPISIKFGYEYMDWYDRKLVWVFNDIKLFKPNLQLLLTLLEKNKNCYRNILPNSEITLNCDVKQEEEEKEKNNDTGLQVVWHVERKSSDSPWMWMPESFHLNMNSYFAEETLETWRTSEDGKLKLPMLTNLSF